MNDEKPRIMVVDDDKILLKNAAVLLGMNYSVSLYSSGTDALKALSGGNLPSLIMLDVMMPDINGYDVIRSIKAMKQCRDIPVVFLTGLSDEEDELKGLQLGAADYIKKPFSQKILLARLGNILKTNENKPKKLPSLSENFSETECKVAELMIRGYNCKEISDKLFYSYSYVKKLLAMMREKSGCETLGEFKRLLCEERENI